MTTRPTHTRNVDQLHHLVYELPNNEGFSCLASDASGKRRAAFQVLAVLRVSTDVIDIPDHEKDCACCSARMSDIGQDLSLKNTHHLSFHPP